MKATKKTANSSKVWITFQVERELRQAGIDRAKELKVSLSWALRKALEDFVVNKKKTY